MNRQDSDKDLEIIVNQSAQQQREEEEKYSGGMSLFRMA